MAQLGNLIVNGKARFLSDVQSSGTIVAPNFTGLASSATNDSSNQKITSTYIKGLSVNGRTITFTRGDNTTGTITTQDTNTTYVVGTASALGLTKLYTATGSATDGTMTQKAITDALNGKSNTNHTHDAMPNSEIDKLFA